MNRRQHFPLWCGETGVAVKYRSAILVPFLFLSLVFGQGTSELRGVWLTNVDSNVLSSDLNITEAMDYLASIGVNVVFPVVYNKGYTLYPSAIMQGEFAASVLPNSPFVNRDFLDRLVIEAHRNGIEVIPWFEFGFATSYSENGGHILAKYPDWALKDHSGALVVDNGFDWMSPLNPNAQNFMVSLMMETLDHYDIDGVQGDDRLPAMPVEGGYDSVTAQIYKSENSGQAPPYDFTNTAWKRWRADKLTQLLSRIRDSVKVRGSNMILSVAPAPYSWGYDELLQDSKAWAQQHLIDNLIPQLYQKNISDYSWALNTTWNDVGQYNPSVFTAGVLARSGTYVVDTTLLGQMLTANRNKGTNGHCFFFYEALRANTNLIGSYLKNRFYQTRALLPFRNGKQWRPKAQIVNETDASVSKIGNWAAYPMRGYEGKILRTQDIATYAGINYTVSVPASASYDVYSYRVPNTTWTTHAVYTLYGEADSTKVIVDQSDLNKAGWFKLGTVYLGTGNRTVVKLDNTLLESGSYLTADAIMIMINRKLSPDVVVSVEEPRDIRSLQPDRFELHQNFPNPFNPETIISYEIPPSPFYEKGEQGGLVSLKVYDLLGREVAVLVNEAKSAGSYTVQWNAGNFPSGIYLYRLTAGRESVSGKMILLK